MTLPNIHASFELGDAFKKVPQEHCEIDGD